MFRITLAEELSALVNEKDNGLFSASEKYELKLITVSAASSFTVISGNGGTETSGQSLTGNIFIETRTSVVVLESVS